MHIIQFQYFYKCIDNIFLKKKLKVDVQIIFRCYIKNKDLKMAKLCNNKIT